MCARLDAVAAALAAAPLPVLPSAVERRVIARLHAESPVLVTDTQTHYRRSTLRAQVRDRLAGQASVSSAEPIQPAITPVAPPSGDRGAPAPPAARPGTPGGPESTSVPVEVVPSTSLVACVLHLTRDVPPEFVDRATYQATPAYIFAVADEIWVVGVDCTAARPTVITAVRISNAS